MSVSKFTQPDFTNQQPNTYKGNIDGAVQVLSRMGAGFAPRAEDTPSMKIAVDAGAIFNRATGGYIAKSAQLTSTITAPGSNSKIVRVYIDELGQVGTVEGAVAASPVAPQYPAGSYPVCRVTITNATTTITNSMITDERAFGSSYGVPKNTFLIEKSTTFLCPPGAQFLRVTAAAAGAGAGGGASSAGDTNKYGGGGGGGGASVIGRLFAPVDLQITIGAKGVGGANAASSGVAATAGTDGGNTVVTDGGANTITCSGGVKGAAATAAANGAGGAGGAAGTGVAGTAGSAGVTNTNGGNGGGTGTGGLLSLGGAGAVLASTRTGTAGRKGSGGGGGIGFDAAGKGGDGGEGFVLIEVF